MTTPLDPPGQAMRSFGVHSTRRQGAKRKRNKKQAKSRKPKIKVRKNYRDTKGLVKMARNP